MIRTILVSVFLVVLSIGVCSCKKEDSTGLDEFIVYEFYNETGTNPVISNYINKSGNVTVGESSAEFINGDAVITIRDIKVQTAGANYEVKKFIVEEDNGPGYREEYEFDPNSENVKTDIAATLVLDMSTSVEEIIDQLKQYAIEFSETIVNSSDNSLVSIVFFNSRSQIESTGFYNSGNINTLIQEINGYSNFVNKTALFQATNTGIEVLSNLTFEGQKSIVVFSDGGDNDSDNPSSQLALIKDSDISRYTIGLRGKDFVESDLKNITSPGGVFRIADNSSDLQAVFKKIALGVVSVYTVDYSRSNQKLTSEEKINIRFKLWSERID